MRDEPKFGEIYRHFKSKLYQIITVAIHSETEEKLVIYQALYGEYGVYAGPLEMFMAEVDREKYPRSGQKYIFEKISNIGEPVPVEKQAEYVLDSDEEGGKEEGEKISGFLTEFLDAKGYGAKKQILLANKQLISDKELDVIFDIYGIIRKNSDIEIDIADLAGYLDLQEQFEGKRLRK